MTGTTEAHARGYGHHEKSTNIQRKTATNHQKKAVAKRVERDAALMLPLVPPLKYVTVIIAESRATQKAQTAAGRRIITTLPREMHLGRICRRRADAPASLGRVAPGNKGLNHPRRGYPRAALLWAQSE